TGSTASRSAGRTTSGPSAGPTTTRATRRSRSSSTGTGTSWKIVPAPTLANDDFVRGLAVRTPNDAWFVGEALSPPPSYDEQTLAAHWNGRRWKIVDTAPGGEPELNDVLTLAKTNVWIVGD